MTEMSLSPSRNLVTEISFSSSSFVTAESSRRKLAKAVSMNLVTVISFASRNLAVAVPKNSIMVNSRYLVAAKSSWAYSKNLVTVVSRNLVTDMSSGF